MTVLLAARLPGLVGDLGTWILTRPILYPLAVIVAVVTALTGLAYLLRMEYAPVPNE